MAIVYYPGRRQKKYIPAIDKFIKPVDLTSFRYSQDISAQAIDQVFSVDFPWRVNSISFEFSNANARNYSVKVLRGRRIIAGLNDYLWIQISNSLWQSISLNAGFYTGTQLASHLQTQLDANSEFSSLGVTFTVAYDNLIGLYTITPSKNNIRYINNNSSQTLSYRPSIAGHLFGFTADTAWGASITSDTPVYGLDDEAAIIDETGSVVLEHYHDDLHYLSIDQSLHIETNTANVNVSMEIVYEDIE